MGFFSWNTADTDEAIMNIHTGENKTVYMLSPDGKVYREDEYFGYGVFGGKDAYVHLCEINNVERDEDWDDASYGDVGIDIEMGTFYVNMNTGDLMRFKHERKYFEWVRELDAGWDNPQDLLGGMNMRNALRDRVVIEIPIRPFLLKGRKYNPLKFSFCKDAIYSNLPESKNEPGQGFGF